MHPRHFISTQVACFLCCITHLFLFFPHWRLLYARQMPAIRHRPDGGARQMAYHTRVWDAFPPVTDAVTQLTSGAPAVPRRPTRWARIAFRRRQTERPPPRTLWLGHSRRGRTRRRGSTNRRTNTAGSSTNRNRAAVRVETLSRRREEKQRKVSGHDEVVVERQQYRRRQHSGESDRTSPLQSEPPLTSPSPQTASDPVPEKQQALQQQLQKQQHLQQPNPTAESIAECQHLQQVSLKWTCGRKRCRLV